MIIECVVFFNACKRFVSGQNAALLYVLILKSLCIEFFIKMESPAETAVKFEIISSTIKQVWDLQTETM